MTHTLNVRAPFGDEEIEIEEDNEPDMDF